MSRDEVADQVKEYLISGKEPASQEANELAKKFNEFNRVVLREVGNSEDVATNMELRDYYSKGIKPQDPKILKMIQDNEKDRAEEIEKVFLESDPDYKQFKQDKKYLS